MTAAKVCACRSEKALAGILKFLMILPSTCLEFDPWFVLLKTLCRRWEMEIEFTSRVVKR